MLRWSIHAEARWAYWVSYVNLLENCYCEGRDEDGNTIRKCIWEIRVAGTTEMYSRASTNQFKPDGGRFALAMLDLWALSPKS
jgi:hypothetical protein